MQVQMLELPATVLLAENNVALREELAHEIRLDGYHVVELQDGLELLEYLQGVSDYHDENPPDVVVAETALPGCDGYSACAKLHELGRDVPFILLTSLVDVGAFEDAERAGAAFLLEKPVGPRRLRDALSAALGGLNRFG